MHTYNTRGLLYVGASPRIVSLPTPHHPRHNTTYHTQYEAAALRPPFDASSHASLAHKINAGKVARIPDR